MKKPLVIFAALSALTSSGYADAKVYIDLSAPAVKKLIIAVEDFSAKVPAGDSKPLKDELMSTLKSDLMFSGLFTVVEAGAISADGASGGATKDAFGRCRALGADTLVGGSYSAEKESVVVEARFYDCVNQKELIARRYVGSPANPRKLIHYFADHLYEELTGKQGIFTTRLLFVSDRTGNKEIHMSDYDGKNVRRITGNRSINLSPQWSPDGKKIIYTSYKRKRPSLYMLDAGSGVETTISDRPGINISGRFSPDGARAAFTGSAEKSPELYVVDIASGKVTRLTDNHGIDVSPSWSPDGKKMAFVSDTSGNPHIFMLHLDSGELKRLTYDGKYNSSPSWSPDGKRIAYARSDNGSAFNIWVMDPDGSNVLQLTFDGNNKTPSWSPDSRFIVFGSTGRGQTGLYIMQSDGSGTVRVDTGAAGDKSPAWSPYLH